MGTVQLTLDLDDDAAKRLFEIFGIDPAKDGNNASALQKAVAQAALTEYGLMVTGERAPSTMRDLRELRLHLLALNLPAHLPRDEQVAELFQLTRTQARTLVNGTRARYRIDLERMLTEAGKDALRKAGKVNESTVRITASDSLITFLTEIIQSAPPPTKRTDASHQYDVTRSTVDELCDQLGLPIDEVKNLPKKK